MLPKVFEALNASMDVQAIIGAGESMRAYRHDSVPQDVVAPYVSWSAPAGDTQIVLDRVTDADTFRINVNCWSLSDDGVEQLASVVRAALEQRAVLVAYLADERDPETQKYRFSFALDWIIGRD